MVNLPNPQIIIGKPSTGQQGDSSAQAYNKYNLHSHGSAQSSNPLLLNIKPGFFVSAINEFGTQLFDIGTQVSAINSTQIELTTFPIINSNSSLVYFTDNNNSQNVIAVDYVNINNTKDFIKLPQSNGGVLTNSQAKYISLDNFNGFLPLNNPLTIKVFPIVVKNITKSYLHRLDIQLITVNTSATATVSVLINNTNLETFSILNTSPVSLDLDFNTLTRSSLVNENDSVKIFIGNLTTTQTSVLLAYNLYLHRI